MNCIEYLNKIHYYRKPLCKHAKYAKYRKQIDGKKKK